MARNRSNAQVPVAITSVAPSLDDQQDARRRKYLIMMGIRVVCVIAAVITAPFSLWLALLLIGAGAVLPWCAVIIANDRPARRATTFVRYRPRVVRPQLPAAPVGTAAPARPAEQVHLAEPARPAEPHSAA